MSEQEELTQAQLLFKVTQLSNRIYQVRWLLNNPDANKSRNWTLSCQLVKLMAERKKLQEKLYGPVIEVDNTDDN
ncbi:hypothetical protein UFOVP344_7 [uncultured Caudovirales phage]|uniref:Uncharacterized protein n=1 Tax=uncultured Caudovirales phage TaxID=2100421 RepID=A0A6J5LW75_9CAUD|nr:hypothetical protein UFOVP344_7 [uncultured Caudovirales phage]